MADQRATAEHIRMIYKSLLEREPDQGGLQAFLEVGELDTIISMIRNSSEAKALMGRTSPFYHFNSQIDAAGIIKRHENHARSSVPGRLVNYLGVIIDPAYLPSLLDGRQGSVEEIPIPSNWHADMAEFAAALRAVDLAETTFRMIELGCGWGCWLLNTGVAARAAGLKPSLIGVEGDAGHIEFARQGCIENGFSGSEAQIHRRIVGGKHGTALFPKQEKSGEQWGLQAVFDASDEQIAEAQASGKYDILPVVTLDDFVENGQIVDLLHMDVQGVEADFIDNCIGMMNNIVAYLVVGTHSREIEGRIFRQMRHNGWVLEIERPALLMLTQHGPVVTVDGVHGWRNPRLR